jgi:RNA polymerase sigma-70 factor (ECF subfamily)
MQPPDLREFAVLATRAKLGDEAAMDELLRKTVPVARNMMRASIGNAEDAKDVLQKVLWEVWASVRNLRDPVRYLGWLSRIVVTRARDFLRKTHRDAEMRSLEDGYSGDDYPDPEARDSFEELLYRDFMLWLTRLVNGLPEKYRRVLALSLFEDLSVREIATRMEIKLTTAKSLVHRGMKKVRAELGRKP